MATGPSELSIRVIKSWAILCVGINLLSGFQGCFVDVDISSISDMIDILSIQLLDFRSTFYIRWISLISIDGLSL